MILLNEKKVAAFSNWKMSHLIASRYIASYRYFFLLPDSREIKLLSQVEKLNLGKEIARQASPPMHMYPP